MVKGNYKPGDKIVPKDGNFRFCEYKIWTVKRMSQSYIVAYYTKNGTQREKQFLPFDIRCVFHKGEQMLLPFMCN